LIRLYLPAILLAAMAARPAACQQGQGQLDASQTLFTVMAAINAAGYDADLQSPNNHPLRDAVRAELAKRKIPSLNDLKDFFREHRRRSDTAELSQYISFAMAVDGPPEFHFKARSVEIPPDAAALSGLARLLSNFYAEAGIEELWNRSQPSFDQYIERYHEQVARAVLQVNAYLRNDTGVNYLGRHFQIYIDLLAAPNQVHTRGYGSEYYVVVTPSPAPRIGDIRHAYLTFLLDPLATRSTEVLERKKGLIDHAQRAEALSGFYKNDFLSLTTASLVKAVEARLDRKPQLVTEALKQGFILTPFFAEQLPLFEKQESAMRFYYPEMVKSIDLKKEDARLSTVEFASEAPVRMVQAPAPAAPEPVLTGAAKTLEEAERLYTSRDLEKARQAFTDALQQTEDKALHARSWYGLPRIAALEKHPELAERLFQKTLESSPEPPVKAWTLVYLGRLSDAAGERDQAAQHYRNALAVQGASDAARRAAEQGVQQSFKKPDN
jgi:tetratricopeptide (TPR) repeat protein